MMYDEIDHALSGEVRIAPSPEFVNRVMDAVHREASAPAPISFPWKRAMPGFVAGALALMAMIVGLVGNARRPPAATNQSGLIASVAHAIEIAKTYGLGWILLTTLIAAACLVLSMRITTRRWGAL